jgi:hypothetical protein
MKQIWSCRRTFLATISIVGLLLIMDKKDKDYSLEVVGLAGGIAFVNAWQKKGKKDEV